MISGYSARMKKLLGGLLLSGAVAIAGCGGSDATSQPGPGGTVRNVNPWTEQQVMTAAHLTPEDGGVSWTTSTGCTVSVIMVSRNEVATYADAGDPVATNSDGTAGVKFDGTAKCAKELESGMAGLK
jgi:hypothetical protein